MVQIRFHSFTDDSRLTERWRALLANANVKCLGDDAVVSSGRSGHVIVVLFDRASDTLLEWVRNKTKRELARVIVLLPTVQLEQPDVAWELRRAGAAEVLAHDGPFAAETVAARLRRWDAVDELLSRPGLGEEIVGGSPAFLALLRGLVEVAAFTTASILLLGESGTGKEQLARLVHALDPRAGKRELVTLDCTTVAPELAASEFFGHERGAFTGALSARDGAFCRADGGTLFLDEVGELSLPLQAQLLRVVQEGTYKRLGANEWQTTRFRLVAATNRSLSEEVERERFRLDFFHRLATWTFRVPPLRDRPDDIVPLARHFIRKLTDPAVVDIDERVQQFLIRRSYPGNVRELKQLMGRICSRHVGPGPITIGDVPPVDLDGLEIGDDRVLADAAARAALAGVGLKEIGRIARESAIRKALESTNQSVQSASRLLRVTDRALQLDLAKREP
jgi:transcriptional regulator with GAF, ATPase, and Fis domain